MKQVLVLCLLFWTLASAAEVVVVGVAANFAETMERLKSDFEAVSEHRIRVMMGSTGALYAQVVHGAPMDVLLAADEVRPAQLVADRLAVAGSQFTYAVGRLTLWSADPSRVGDSLKSSLLTRCSGKVAIANPEVAPYGAAAMETIQALAISEQVASRLVMGANIGQTHAMVRTGNANCGFVALSYVLSDRNKKTGSRLNVPIDLHQPIRQDAVLLRRAVGRAGARAWFDYLRSDRAASIVRQSGYDLAESGL